MSGFDDLRFAAGEAFAVTGDDVVAVLPKAARSRVAALWELVDAGAGLDEVLDALVGDGISSLGGLALVGRHGGALRVLVRGDVSAVVLTDDGEVALRAAAGTTWLERIVEDATGFRIAAGAAGEATSPLPAGLVRVGAVVHGPPGTAGPETPAAAYDTPEPEPAAADVAAPVAAEAPQEPEQEDVPVADDTVSQPLVSRPVAALVFSTGQHVEVDRVVLVGRAPEGRRFASHELPRTITVPSPNQEISSTHLEIRPGSGADHGSAVVTDLGSTNGTVLAQPGLQPEELEPGIAVSLVPGAVLDLGDGVTIQVTSP
ncbi:MAG: FHA domain-containing protein [Nocardioides sp.]|nr:FHA domain-containing protein [Nocardioides sp.]